MVVNTLFNQKRMKTLIKKYESQLKVHNPSSDPITDWINRLKEGTLNDEKSNYDNFSTIILNRLLGYDINDYKHELALGHEGRPVEYVLLKDTVKYVVCELKGTKTADLNRRYGRNQSAIEQVTNYATILEETQWAMVSNYDEFRLFSPSSKEKYISFRFEELTDPYILKQFLLVFSKFSLIDNQIPQSLLFETKTIERSFEKDYYKLYSETRLMLIEELMANNNLTKLDAIKYSQLILNRYIFICFAEDLELLPQEISSITLLDPIKEGDLYETTLWERLTRLFRFINEGNEAKKIKQYNGGLFAEDLRKLTVRDFVDDADVFFKDCKKEWKFESEYDNLEIIKQFPNINPIFTNLLVMASFDFESDVDVNIIGHIFENSIGDIEELKNETITRRKSDGIYYTPNYITEYICSNTIIPFLSKSGNAKTITELINEYPDNEIDDLDKKVKDIKILDPACGSGACLNKATDILLEIHQAIHDAKYENDTTLDPFFDTIETRKEILLDNIFGVDINEESVEISKLALFLKVSKPGLKLPNLDKNIKCGNSLIFDEELAGNKSFNWDMEFEDVISNGGFDIVVGNPPYVRQEEIDSSEKTYLKNNFECCTDSTNLYVAFFERGIKLLNENGIFSFICSNKFATVDYGKKLRKFLLNYRILNYNDYAGVKIFADAEVDTCIIVIKKTDPKNNLIYVNEKINLPQKLLTDDLWFFSSVESLLLKDKLFQQGVPLKDIKAIEINNGIKTGYNKAFYITKDEKKELIELDENNENIIKPLLVGKNIKPWRIHFEEQYIIFSRQGIDIDNYPTIKDYLSKFKKYLTPKITGNEEFGRKPGDYKWYEIQDKTAFYENFEKPKLIWSEMNKQISFVYDEDGYYTNNKCFIITSDEIDLAFLNGLFLSDLFKFIFMASSSSLGSTTVELRKSYVKKVPIILSDEYISKISHTVSNILNINKQTNFEIESFLSWLKLNGKIKLSEKLLDYYMMEFEEFYEELENLKYHNLNHKDTHDLLKIEFENNLNIIKPLIREFKELEIILNKQVYELYNLSPEEINLVEENIKNLN